MPRDSGVETLHVAGVGEVEAWHEGFMPWLLELDVLKALKLGTQKTVRWPRLCRQGDDAALSWGC